MLSRDLDRAAAYASRAGTVFAVLTVVVLAIFGGRYLVCRYRLAQEFGSGGRHDLIRLNLKPPSATISGSLETRI